MKEPGLSLRRGRTPGFELLMCTSAVLVLHSRACHITGLVGAQLRSCGVLGHPFTGRTGKTGLQNRTLYSYKYKYTLRRRRYYKSVQCVDNCVACLLARAWVAWMAILKSTAPRKRLRHLQVPYVLYPRLSEILHRRSYETRGRSPNKKCLLPLSILPVILHCSDEQWLVVPFVQDITEPPTIPGLSKPERI